MSSGPDMVARRALYTAGETISFAGQATDLEDGNLPASAFSWTVLFHHDTHTHPELGPINGVTSGSFTAPTVGHTEDTVFYRIYLTVTDSSGVQTQVTREVTPRKAQITLNSNRRPCAERLVSGDDVGVGENRCGDSRQLGDQQHSHGAVQALRPAEPNREGRLG